MIVYYGPTMGKTYACKFSPDLVDFDDLVREDMNKMAEKLKISVREFKSSNNFWYKLIIKKWLIYSSKLSNKLVMVSNIGALDYPEFFHGFFIPSRDVFVERNIKRGGNAKDSNDWYDALITKGSSLFTVDDRFVTEILNDLYEKV